MTTAFLLNDIKGYEGLRLEAYPDPLTHAAPWTIGFGSTGPGIGPDTVWTVEQAESDLTNRVTAICAKLDALTPWWRGLTDVRQDVLVIMAYQMGVVGLLQFRHSLGMIQDGDYSGAADGLLQSLWARQTPKRAQRLAEQMRTGVRA